MKCEALPNLEWMAPGRAKAKQEKSGRRWVSHRLRNFHRQRRWKVDSQTWYRIRKNLIQTSKNLLQEKSQLEKSVFET